MNLFYDAEVYNELDVAEVGSHCYVRHPSMRPVLHQFATDESRAIAIEQGASPLDMLRVLHKRSVVKWNLTKGEPLVIFHWGEFDRLVAQAMSGWASEWSYNDWTTGVSGPLNTLWVDLSEISVTFGAPQKLELAAPFWTGGSYAKQKGGKKLIQQFCSPNEFGERTPSGADPVAWAKFCTYGLQDCDVLKPTKDAMFAVEGGHAMEQHAEAINAVRRMNDRGIMVDVPRARKVTEPILAIEAELTEGMVKHYGFKPKSYKKIAEFLGTPNAQKDTIEEYIHKKVGSPGQQEVAQILQILSGAARTKLIAMERWDAGDHINRGCFQYHGPHTRRMSARGPQPQNCVRARYLQQYFDDIDAGRDFGYAIFEETRRNIRGFFVARPDHLFVAGDYSKIELCVAAWVAGELELLEDLHAGNDVYRRTAGRFYGVDPDSIPKDDDRRQFGKTIELAGQFGQGGGGIYRKCVQEKIPITESECHRARDVYRDSRPAIVQCWADMEAAFRALIDAPHGSSIEVGPVRFERHPAFIKLVRPSGFAQYFWHPRVVPGEWPDGSPKEDGDIRYVGKTDSGFMGLVKTYGAKVFQGCVQGIAADLLLEALPECEKHGFALVMQIHDEVVAEIPFYVGHDDLPQDIAKDQKEAEDFLCQILEEVGHRSYPGLPVVAEGWHDVRFTKG